MSHLPEPADYWPIIRIGSMKTLRREEKELLGGGQMKADQEAIIVMDYNCERKCTPIMVFFRILRIQLVEVRESG
jgi:hypothetical protein